MLILKENVIWNNNTNPTGTITIVYNIRLNNKNYFSLLY